MSLFEVECAIDIGTRVVDLINQNLASDRHARFYKKREASIEPIFAPTMTSTDSKEIPGDTLSAKSTILETGAALVQDFQPVKQICAHLNAFHIYASDPKRFVETNHYCAHLTEGGYSVAVVQN